MAEAVEVVKDIGEDALYIVVGAFVGNILIKAIGSKVSVVERYGDYALVALGVLGALSIKHPIARSICLGMGVSGGISVLNKALTPVLMSVIPSQ